MTTPAPPDDWFLPDEDAVLQMRRVRVRRGTTDILGPLDWTVRAGQRWIVMGPNGAGKSTLLQLAAARLHPTAGDVGVLDEVLGAVDVFELRPRIGLSSAQLAAQVPANEIGLAVLEPLRALDEVAYLRFASVYKSFESADDFESEIRLMRRRDRDEFR